MATLRTKYKPWLKTEYRGTEIDLPHEASHVVTNPLGEIVAYTSEPRIGGDGWAASGFMYVLGYNADPTRWWESCVTSGYLMDVAAGVLPREAKQQAYRNYWYAGGPIRVPTWAQWLAEDQHGNVVVIEGAMRPKVSVVCTKWANSRNQLFVRRDRPADNWRQTLINLDHLSQMEFKRPKGFPDELRPVCYQSKEVLVPLWVNFLTTDADGAIRGHHTRPTIIDKSGWHTAECSRIPMCYLGHTQNKGYWRNSLLILEQKESEQKVEKEQKPKWGTQSDVELVKAWINGATIEQLADAYDMTLDFIHNKLHQFGLLSPNKNGFVTAHVSNDVDETYDIEHILGVQLDGTCGELYYLPKKEDSVELAVLVGFARGFSLKRIAEQTGAPAADVVSSVIHSLAEASNFVNRLRFGYWGDVGELTIAQYKIDKKASPASTQRPTSVGVDVTPAESFTMVTFKLPSKTVATQETMLTDEMFLAGVAFGMRLNKLLSKLDDKND